MPNNLKNIAKYGDPYHTYRFINHFVFVFFSYLIFTPSITFSVIHAEIFPWALIFTMLYIKKIHKEFIVIVLLFSLSSVYGFFLSGGNAYLEVVRSLFAYFNSILIFIILLRADFSFIKRLFSKVKIIFYILIVLGFLQYFELISFLDSFVKLLIPRGSADSLAFMGNRGVTLLASEPSRASYEFLFIYMAYRILFLTKKNYLIFDIFVLIFMLFIIKSGIGLILVLGFFAIFYRLNFILFATISIIIMIPFLDFLGGRAFDLLMSIITTNSLESLYDLILNASGFRVISIISSFYYGCTELFGGGIGNWQLSSIEALNLTGYNPSDISFFRFRSDGEWMSIRPPSYFFALILDIGIIGTLIFVYYIYKVLYKFFIIDSTFKSIIVFFLLYSVITGAVGNPVPFITTAIALRYLYEQKLTIKERRREK